MLSSETHEIYRDVSRKMRGRAKKFFLQPCGAVRHWAQLGKAAFFFELQPRLAVKCHWLLSSPPYLHTHREEALRVHRKDHRPNWTDSADTPRPRHEELYRADANILVMHRSVLEIRRNFSPQQTCIQNPSSSHKGSFFDASRNIREIGRPSLHT